MSGTNDNTGGAGNQDSGADLDKLNAEKVAYSTYKKTVDEVKQLKDKLKAFESEKETNTENKLKEQNEWKALADQRETQLKETKTRLNDLESTILDSVKISAFKRNLGGNLRDDVYLSFVDTDKIIYHPETKKVDDESVKTVVAEFVKRHAHLVDFGTGRMPNEAARGADGKFIKNVDDMKIEDIEKALLTGKYK